MWNGQFMGLSWYSASSSSMRVNMFCGVEIGVAGGLPQVEARHVRRVDQRIAALQVLVAHPVFELLADDAALGMEEDQARAGQFLNAEQVEFLAQLAVVALLGLFELA